MFCKLGMCAHALCSAGAIMVTQLRTVMEDPAYRLRYDPRTGLASDSVRVFPHQSQELLVTDRVRLVSMSGKGTYGNALWKPLERVNADSGSGQPSVLFDRNAAYSGRLITQAAVNPGERGKGDRQPATAWDRLMLTRSAVMRA